MVTQRDITSKNLEIERISDEVESLREAYPTWESMPKAKQERCESLDAELASARGELAELGKQWREGQRKTGHVQRLATPGVSSEVYADDYGFDKYMRMRRGRLLNFANTPEGFKRAELAGALFYAGAIGDVKQELRSKARAVLTSGEHDLTATTYDDEGRAVRTGPFGQPLTRDLTSAVESLGGALVPTVLEASIYVLAEQYGILPKKAEVIPMSGAKLKWPRRGRAIVGGWSLESLESEFDKNMNFSSFELDAKDYFLFAGFPNQLAQDSLAPIGDFIAGQMGWRQAYDWDRAWLQGMSTSENGNILGCFDILQTNIPGTSNPNPGLVTAASGSATDWTKITDDDLLKTRGRPRLYSNDTSQWEWYVTNPFWNEVMVKRQMNGNFGMQATFADGKVSVSTSAQQFWGHNVNIVPGPLMPLDAIGAEIVALFGSLQQATTLGVRLGMEIMSTPLAGRAWFTYSTYMRAVQRGDISNHDWGLSTYDPENNNIAGPMVGLTTAS